MDYSTKPFTFKKKPVAIEAIKWIGTNFDTIKMFDPSVMLSGEGELMMASSLLRNTLLQLVTS